MKLLRKAKSPSYAYGEGSFLGETEEVSASPSKTKLVFLGSGPVAAKALKLLSKNFEIEVVITKPKPAHHRGDFPVIATATQLNLQIETAADKKSLSALIHSRKFASQVAVLIDFGIIVGQDVIDCFPLGIINSHFSVLPEWRGADPITFAVLSGQKVTGVSLMLLVEAMDEGPLLAYREHPIHPQATTESLTEELIILSNELLSEHLPSYIRDQKTIPQAETGRAVSYSRKLTKQDGLIDVGKPAAQLEREIRAFSTWPKSTVRIGNQDVIITDATVVNLHGEAGRIEIHEKDLILFTTDGALCIDKLKPSGKQEMSGRAFIAGYGRSLDIS